MAHGCWRRTVLALGTATLLTSVALAQPVPSDLGSGCDVRTVPGHEDPCEPRVAIFGLNGPEAMAGRHPAPGSATTEQVAIFGLSGPATLTGGEADVDATGSLESGRTR